MLVNDFQRQADGVRAVFHEGQQQPVGVVQSGAVILPLSEFFDIGCFEVIAFDGFPNLAELFFDAARIQVPKSENA